MSSDWATAHYYSLLEVDLDVDPESLKHASWRMAQLHHPDANPHNPAAADRFQQIARADAVLSDLDQKAVHDRVQARVTVAQKGGAA